MANKLLAIVLSALFGMIGGFFIGRANHEGSPQRSFETALEMELGLREAFLSSEPRERMRSMDLLVNAIDEENLPGAIRVFREFANRAETLGVSQFFGRWAQIDPDGLLVELRTWPNEKASAQGAGWLAYEIAYQDGTAAAIQFYNGLSTRLKIVTGYRLIEGALNAGDESGLVEWVAVQQDEGERSRLTQSILMKLLRESGADGLTGFFDRVPDGAPNDYKRQVFLVSLNKLVRHDSAAAVKFRADRIDQEYAQNSMSALAVAWADVDPAAAVSWIESQAPSSERDRSLEATLDRWVGRDQAGAVDWARAQPPSPLRDRLFQRFVGSMTIRDPETAMELAQGISDDTIRRTCLRNFARYWFNRKPGETHEWLVSGGLSTQDARAVIDELATTRQKRIGRKGSSPKDRGPSS